MFFNNNTQLVGMKLGHLCIDHDWRAALRHFANQFAIAIATFNQEKAL